MEGLGESDLSTADYSRPSRTCDVVMKGGITSGVVYPHAVVHAGADLPLQERRRHLGRGDRRGGAAAAEYGRARGGFQRLAELPEWMGSDGNLLGLFQPQAGTAGLFAVLVGALEGRASEGVAGLRPIRIPLAALAGAALGLALFVSPWRAGLDEGFDALVVVALAGGSSPPSAPRWDGGAAGPTAHPGSRRQRVRDVLGRAWIRTGGRPALTPWLSAPAQGPPVCRPGSAHLRRPLGGARGHAKATPTVRKLDDLRR